MRKWIFGLLLLVNIGFFAVMQMGGALTADTNSPPTQPALNPEKIKIVSMVAAATSAPVSAVPAASALTVASSVAMASSVAATALPVAASIPVPPPLPAPAMAQKLPPAKLTCLEWGEFSAADYQRVETMLEPLKLGERAKTRVVDYNSGFWVYISPLKTPAMVKKKVAQLKKFEVEDYFVIQESGPWKNAISLGMFKTEDAAKKYLAKLKSQGVKSAQFGARASKLKYSIISISRLDAASVSRINALRKEFPDSEIKQISCN